MTTKQQKIGLVSGGMGGIGTAICRALAQDGVKVIAMVYKEDLEHEDVVTWKVHQAELGFDMDTIYMDVADADSCAKGVAELYTRYPSVDILVNNAGVTRDKVFSKMTLEEWSKVMDVNVNSLFNLTQPVLQGMLERGYGRIVNISSVNGQKGQYGQTNYSASKAAVHGFTKALAQEVAKHHITVNTVSPGYTDTPMVKLLSEEVRAKIIATIPVGRLAEPYEIARMVAFLAAEDSGFITGANFSVNGGQHFY